MLQYILQHGGTAVLQNEDTQVYLLEANHDIELTNVQEILFRYFRLDAIAVRLRMTVWNIL